MDNLLGTGGATASRLTLPQKIIATGMSVILAFGLSPIGQAPAYAKEKAKAEVATEQVVEKDKAADEAVEAQAEPEAEEADEALEAQALEADWTATYEDKLIFTMAAQRPDFKSITLTIDGQPKYTLVQGTDYLDADTTYYKQADDGTASATTATGGAATAAPINSGKYVARVKLDKAVEIGDYTFAAGSTHDFPFEITKVNIGDATVTPQTPYTAVYTGENIIVPSKAFGNVDVKWEIGKNAAGVMQYKNKNIDYVVSAADSTAKEIGSDGKVAIVPTENAFNFEGTALIGVTVTKAVFKNAWTGVTKVENAGGANEETVVVVPQTLRVNGKAYADTTADTKYADYRIVSVQTGATVGDPLETVKIGDQELTRGDAGYTVKWLEDDAATEATSYLSTNGVHYAEITCTDSTHFDLTGGMDANGNPNGTTYNTIKVAYEIAKDKDFVLTDVAKRAVVAKGTYNPTGAGSPAKQVTFFDVDGNEVAVDAGNYSVVYYVGPATVGEGQAAYTYDKYTATAPVNADEYYVAILGPKAKLDTTTGAIVGTDYLEALYVVDPLQVTAGTATGQFDVTLDNTKLSSVYNGTFAPASVKTVNYVKDASALTDKYVAINPATDVIDGYVVEFKLSDSEFAYGTVASAGTYDIIIKFGTIDEGTFTQSDNYTGELKVGTYTVAPCDLSKVKPVDQGGVVYAPGTYTGVGQDPATTLTWVNGYYTAAELPDADQIAEDVEAGSLKFTYGAAESGGSFDPASGKPLTVGLYTAVLSGTGNYVNSAPTAVFQIGKLTNLADYKLQVKDPDTGMWLDATAAQNMILLRSAATPDYRVVKLDAKGKVIGQLVEGTDYTVKVQPEGNALATRNDRILTATFATNGANVAREGEPESTALTYNVADKAISDVWSIEMTAATVDFTAKDIDPQFTVVAADTKATIATDRYTWSLVKEDGSAVTTPQKAFEAGTYYVQVKPKADQLEATYAGTLSAKFTVNPFAVSDSNVAYVKVAEGEAVTDALSGKGLEVAVLDDEQMKYSPNNTEGKNYVLGVYLNGQQLKQYVASEDAAAKANKTKYKYDYKLAYSKTPIEVGDYTATLDFSGTKGNLSGSVTKAFSVTAQELQDLVMLFNGLPGREYTPTFNGLAKEPTISFSSDWFGFETVIPSSDIAAVVYENNVNASYGTADVMEQSWAKVTVVVNSGDYQGKAVGYFQIAPVAFTDNGVTVQADATANTYTGSAIAPKFNVTLTSGDNVYQAVEGFDYIVQVTKPATNVGEKGTARLIAANQGNFDKTPYYVDAEFEVQKADSTITIADKTVTYNGKAQAVDAAKVTGSTGAVTYAYFSDEACTKAAEPINAGTYYAKATVAADANYNGAESNVAKLTVKKAANTTIKVTAKKKSYTFKKAKKNFKPSKLYKVSGNKGGGLVYSKGNKAGGKNITVAKNGKIKCKKGLKNGTYKVKVKYYAKANANYNKSKAKTVTIKIVKKAPKK